MGIRDLLVTFDDALEWPVDEMLLGDDQGALGGDHEAHRPDEPATGA